MSQTNNTSNADKNSGLEVFAIFAAMIIIFLIWVNYPKFMQSMDNPVQDKNPKIVIPYKAQQEAEPAKDETQFQKVGEKYGTYGDSYGSLNTLFSGLAFAMLIISLFMQRQELQAQRKELEAQRNEIKESNAIAEKQRQITEQQATLNAQQINDAKVQNFYTLLFKFLEEKHRKVEEMDGRSTTGNLNGDTQFDKFIHFIEIDFEGSIDKLDFDNEALDPDAIGSYIYQAVLYANDQTNNVISNSEYFEYLCFILRFIESHKDLGITEDAIKVFISYQSFNEAYAMFLFSIYLDDEELQTYITKYALLRKLNTFQTEDENFSDLAYFLLGEDASTP